MKRIKLFSDWADSEGLYEQLRSGGMVSAENEIVWGDDFDVAVVFNFATDRVPGDFPYGRTVGLVLEPREILDAMYQGWEGFDPSYYAGYYAFAGDLGSAYQPAPGVGFPQVDLQKALLESEPWSERENACMIVSSKVYTAYQRKRREVFRALLDSDLPIDFYGRGMEASEDPRVKGEIPQGDKEAVLTKYRYAIDFENCPTALTDKFFDPVLCGAVPVTNSRIGLPGKGWEWIDFERSVPEIVDSIRVVLSAGEVPSGRLLTEVTEGHLSLTAWIDQKVRELT